MESRTGASCNLTARLTPKQRARYQDDDTIRYLLRTSKTIAIVGLSFKAEKASNIVASYIQDKGYRIIPVNPIRDEILGQRCYPDLASVQEKIDIVDIFRPSDEVPAILNQALTIGAKAIWMQLRIVHFEAAELALSKGLKVVIDKCIKTEFDKISQ